MVYQMLVSADGTSRRFTYVSPSCVAMNGVQAEAILADPMVLYDLIIPEHRAAVAAAEKEAMASGGLFDIEAAFRRPDGELRWNRLTSAPRPQDDGSMIWDGIQIDITTRKLAEDSLRREQNRLALALEATGLGFWEYDIKTGHLEWSERTKANFGLAPDADVSFEVYQAGLHPEDRETTLAAYEEARQRPGGGDFSSEHRTVSPEGVVRWLLAHGRVLVDEDGAPERVLGTTMDITERKAADEMRGLLFSELSHRVKNNFQVIAAMLELQARHSDHPETKAQLSAAVDRVMAVARAHANLYADGKVESVEFAGYLRDLCGALDRGLLDRGRIVLEVVADTADLEPDRAAALGMLVNELVTNAVKHAFHGRDRGRIEVRFEARPQGGRLTVRDDGPGFAKTERASGLGSWLMAGFVRQARGTLTRSSDGGASVVVDLEP